MNRKKQLISRLITILMVVLGVVLLVAGFRLIPKLLEYKASDDAFAEIADGTISEFEPAVMSEMASESKDVDTSDALQIDWDAFAGTEIVAWFQLEGTNYPIMQHSDNDFYLNHLPDGSYNSGGSLFLSADNSPLFTDQSSFVYGHNMNNGSMFGSLKQYTGQESAGKQFSIYLPDGTRHVYQFFSVAIVYHDSKAYTWSFADKQSYLNWQQWMLEQSMVDTGLSPDETASHVTLSTCNGYTGTNHRLIVCGREIRVDNLQQPASWYEEYLAKYQNRRTQWMERISGIASGLSAVQQEKREQVWHTYQGIE